MDLIKKVIRKLKIETKFFTVQVLGLVKPDLYTIPKYMLRKFLSEDCIIIDCGAHIGSDSVELSRIFPKARVHSFEAVPRIYEQLLYNTRKRKNITCHPIALSDQTGYATMHVSSGGDGASSSLLPPKEHLYQHPEIAFDEKIRVKAMSLDDWAEQSGLDHVDFLWLDMQGFEFPMLAASSYILKTVKVIHTEINFTEAYQNVVEYEKLKQWLEGNGFVEFMRAVPTGSSQGNALFIRNTKNGS